MLQSLWNSISSWGDLPANFPYTLGPAVPYGFELPGGFVQFSARSTKCVSASVSEKEKSRHPMLDALLNPSSGSQVSVFALRRDGGSTVPQRSFEQAKNHLARCKTLLHPNLLKVLGTYETSSALYVVTECCFALTHVLYLCQQQQQQQHLAAKRPPGLPQLQPSGPPSAAAAAPDTTGYAAAAAAAAATAAHSSCWNFLELIEGLSFLHDQCKLVHGEVSPFSVFVTPHGKWKLSCFGLSRPMESVHWPGFFSDILGSASAAQGWQPPRPPPQGRPDCIDRWGLCSIFAWWRDSRGDSYRASSFSRGGGTGGAPNSFSISLDESTFRQALQRLPQPLQRLMQQILDPSPRSQSLAKLIETGDYAFPGDVCCQLLSFIRTLPVKSHVDKEAFFEKDLPAVLQAQQLPTAVSLHLLLPELALLLMNSSASAYHCNILHGVFCIVAPLATQNKSINKNEGGPAMPLRLLAEVLEHAFASSDRAIRFALLSHLPSVHSLLPDTFFVRTWPALTLGLEDSAPPIRASTARLLALYASRLPLDSPAASSVYVLLEQRMRDAAGGVRLEAVTAAAGAARDCSEKGSRRAPKSLMGILSASLRDVEGSIRLAGLEASVYCADLLPLSDLVSLLAAASSCFLSASPEVVAATPDCIFALTEAAKARAGEQQQPQQQLQQQHVEGNAIENEVPTRRSNKNTDGWLTTVKGLGAALGLNKRGSDQPAFLSRTESSGSSSSAIRPPPACRHARAGPPPPPGAPPEAPCEPPQPPRPPSANSRNSRSADEFKDVREPVSSWDAWEAAPDFETMAPSRPDLSRNSRATGPVAEHRDTGRASANQESQRGSAPHDVCDNGPAAPPVPRSSTVFSRSNSRHQQYAPTTILASGRSTSSMRLQGSAPAPLSVVAVGAAAGRKTATNKECSEPTDNSFTDDFFAALEKEAKERNF